MPHRLNFHHLRYFWAVAKEGHLTRAAEHLHISQSALSAQIRALESQLGHDLFHREGRRLVLTETGRLVLDYAEGIFALGRELMTEVTRSEGSGMEELRIGSVATLSRNFQENFLRSLIDDGHTRLRLVSGSLDDLLGQLDLHRLDIVLSNRPPRSDHENRWHSRRIARQPVCLVGHPRQTKSSFRFPQDLAELPLVLPGYSSDIRTEFDLLCERLELKREILAEVDDMAMLRLLARDSGGVALIPEVVVQDELRAGILERYCVVPNVHENFYAIRGERKHRAAALDTLLAALDRGFN